MKSQRYNLLTTLIVSALHPNEPFGVGTIWEPTNTVDIHEAEALCEMKYAKHHAATKDDKVEPTWLQKQDAKRIAEEDAADASNGFDPDDLGEGSGDKDLSDAELALILEGSVDAVSAELADLTEPQLIRLAGLEEARERPRKGVADAIADAVANIQSQE